MMDVHDLIIVSWVTLAAIFVVQDVSRPGRSVGQIGLIILLGMVAVGWMAFLAGGR